jgi:hypothetical protein
MAAARLAVRSRGGERGNRRWEKELTGGPRVAVRERGRGGGSGPAG